MRRGRVVGLLIDRADSESTLSLDGSVLKELASLDSSQRNVARAFASARSSERDALRVFGLGTNGTESVALRTDMAGDSGRSWRFLLGGEGSGVGSISGDGARGGRGDDERGYIGAARGDV